MGNTFNFIGDNAEDEVPQVEFEQAVGLAPQEPVEVAQMMSEAEQRFAKAQYYKSLISNHPFSEDFTETAMEVAAEVQAFCRERLTVLLGLKPEAARPVAPATPKDFDSEQVKVLQQVANRLLKKPELAAPEPVATKVQSPVVKPVAKAQAPTPTPLAKAQKPAAKTAGKRAGAATGDTIKIPQADGTTRSYRKMVDPKYGEYWLGENGQQYALETNGAGQNYMKSLNRQARPAPGTPQPRPSLTGAEMEMIAARQSGQAMAQDEVASGRATRGHSVVVASNTPM